MFLFLIIAVAVAALLYVVNVLLYTNLKNTSSSNLLTSTYECGFEALLNQSRYKHTIAYYLIALLYLIFDLEIALILPAIVALASIGVFGTILLLLIMTLLCFCFIYELSLGLFTTIVQHSALVRTTLQSDLK
ncbi:MAG: NADH-quinone oxidoreductase subunit A [Rickettsiales bacterium]|nr:MAG: NADH-quinone oxidoreductase subunit A [Rickettsiales bacterium]